MGTGMAVTHQALRHLLRDEENIKCGRTERGSGEECRGHDLDWGWTFSY
jgi:hypothetical protein